MDVLTTVIIGRPDLVHAREALSIVIPDGPSQGRTVETPDGRLVNVVDDVDRDAFFTYMTDLAATDVL